MSKQLHKNFIDGRVNSLLESYLNKKLRLIIFYQSLGSKEEDFLNY
jgi:hypothetical protein